MSARPNILFILADDLGCGDIGAVNGGLSETPHIDGLMREGMTFTHHYSASTLCSPARAALLTGRYPNRTGVVDTLSVDGLNLMRPEETTVAQVLRGHGYKTGMIGKWHLGLHGLYNPSRRGFEETVVLHDHRHWQWSVDRNGGPVAGADGRYLADMLTDEAVDFIGRHKSEPFFLYLAHFAPHTPLEAPEEDIAPFRGKEGINEQVATLYGMVRRMDAGIGRVLAALDEHGLTDNTLVIFTSDNGPQFSDGQGRNELLKRFNCGLRGRKELVYEGGIKVPAVVRWPGRVSPGTTCHGFVHFTDWFPTLLSVAGAAVPQDLHIDGQTILPLILGAEQAQAERERCWQFSRLRPVRTHNAAARRGPWKLVRPPVPEAFLYSREDLRLSAEFRRFPERFPDGPPASVHRPALPPPLAVELYNVALDPREENNVAAEHPEIVEALGEMLDAWFDEVEAERLNGVAARARSATARSSESFTG